MRSILLVVAMLATLASARTAAASWTHDPSTNLAVAAVAAEQSGPSIASDGQNGSIIAWVDYRNGGYDIFAQRVDAKGAPVWTANGVAVCTASNSQLTPVVVSDGAGGAIITWIDLRLGVRQIYAQRLDAAGTALWAPQGIAMCGVFSVKDYLVATADGSGGVIAAWSDTRNGGGIYDVFAQRVNASGALVWAPSGVLLTGASQDQTYSRIIADGTGGAYVCWHDFNLFSAVQRVNGAGVVQWGANGITLPMSAAYPRVTTDGAGGVIVAWAYIASGGCGEDGFRAQRFNASGTPLWGLIGSLLIPSNCANIQYNVDRVEIAPDGAGGVFAVCSDRRNGSDNRDLWAQRLNASGVRQWLYDGLPVCTLLGDQMIWHPIVADGAGGAYIVWHDPRANGVTLDTYIQRINSAGAPYWTANGVLLSTAANHQSNPVVLEDGRQGVVVAWNDLRTGDWDVYAQRIDSYGYFGDVAPEIAWVRDVPNDQGERVRIRWNASYRDTTPTLGIGAYGIWRQVTESAAMATVAKGGRVVVDGAVAPERGLVRAIPQGTHTTWWEGVGTVLARGEPWYTFAAETFLDSTAAGNPLTTFMVDAHDANFPAFWSSVSGAGYSVDNLPPSVPQGLTASDQSGTTHLDWGDNLENDLAAYYVYRGATPDFVPSPANRIASPLGSSYDDAGASGPYYRVSAVDIHGNESGPATAAGTVDVGDDRPRALALGRPTPNPASGSTLMRLALPISRPVSLAIYDPMGRRIRQLVNGVQEAGVRFVRWDLRDDRGSVVPGGLYFARLDVGGEVIRRRIVAAR